MTSALQTGRILSNPTPIMTNPCKHPQVRVVAREDDVEFVACQICREVFDAAEYLDMAIEEEELAVVPGEEDVEAMRKPAKGRRQAGRSAG